MGLARLVDGTSLEFDDAGSGDPVILIHGAIIARAFPTLVAEAMLNRQYRLISYARRGYAGSSHPPGPLTVHQHAADCVALLSCLGVERAHVVGHSYGGCVALQLALDAPRIVHSLALLEPALAVGAGAAAYREALANGTQRYRLAGAEVALHEFLKARWPSYRASIDELLPGVLSQAVADAATSFEAELPGLLAWRFSETDARRITKPTLSMLGGESNALWPRFGETHRLLLNWLPDSEGLIIPGVTHFLQVENPRAVADGLADFWARHPLSA